MSDLNTREEKLKLVFAAHPQAEEIFMTSDDRAFFDEHNAEAYAQGLKDQEVKRYEKTEDGRPETEEAPVIEEAPVAEEAPVTEEAPVAEKPKKASKAKAK